jgi:hypothetical protein
MKSLEKILEREGVLILDRTDIEIVERAVGIWLNLFREYLPPKTASDHAKGAHDAVKDLESWIDIQDKNTESEEKMQ